MSSRMTFLVKLPIVQGTFTRTFVVDGESVIYVDRRSKTWIFDRPVNWAEHLTLGSPFFQPENDPGDCGHRARTRASR